jgi:arylsulfatase A-like enzyme
MRILVIAPCGFHLGYLGCYGNAWIETPTFDAVAAEGVVFDNHYSNCPSVEGAWRAWRTGIVNFPELDVQSAHPSGSIDLFSYLRNRTIPNCVLTDIPLAPRIDCASAGDEITLIQSKGMPGMLCNKVMTSIRQVESHDNWAIWVQPDLLIPPWPENESIADYFSDEGDDEPGEGSIEPLPNPKLGLLNPDDDITFIRLQRTYAAAVSKFDCEMAELFDRLRRRNLYDSLMIITTTDRGFPLGEHGLVGESRPWLHEESVHIPLIIRLPDGEAGGLRIGSLTQPEDVMPTLIEAFGFPACDCHGSSLLPLIRGQRDQIRNYACSGLERGGAFEWSLRTRDWAFLLPDRSGAAHESSGIIPRSPQLYVKPDDRWEVNNVLQHNLDLAESLEQTLRAFIKAPNVIAHGLPSVGSE